MRIWIRSAWRSPASQRRLAAQPPPERGAQAGEQRPPMTPEQQAAAAARRQAEMNAPRPIDALDSVWMEELTWMEVRDAIKGGKTTALILTGGVESNGPYLATGKHNFVLKVMGEAIARKLGNALVAPIRDARTRPSRRRARRARQRRSSRRRPTAPCSPTWPTASAAWASPTSS